MMEYFVELLGGFCYRFRKAIISCFVLLFVGVVVGQFFVKLSFQLPEDNVVNKNFPEDQMAIIYKNADEPNVAAVLQFLGEQENVKKVEAYFSSLLNQYIIPEQAWFYINQTALAQGVVIDPFFSYYVDIVYDSAPCVIISGQKYLTVFNFITRLHSAIPQLQIDFGDFEPQVLLFLDGFISGIFDSRAQFVGENHSRIILTLGFVPESAAMYEFLEVLKTELNESFENDFYLVGSSAMSGEMSGTFKKEFFLLSLVIALVVYVVIALSMKRILLPAVLVGLIQCAVFAMMSIMVLTNTSIVFIALILVQCVLMGASADYGILMTVYYREARKEFSPEEAVTYTLKKSIGVILTTALSMILVTMILGISTGGAVGSIMISVGTGFIVAGVLFLLVLPALLASLDKFVFKPETKSTIAAEVPTTESETEVPATEPDAEKNKV